MPTASSYRTLHAAATPDYGNRPLSFEQRCSLLAACVKASQRRQALGYDESATIAKLQAQRDELRKEFLAS